MHTRTRRALTAVVSAASVAAGLLATAPGARADTGVSGGQISLYGGSGVALINSDGTGLRDVRNIDNSGRTPNWAPDGSRLVAGVGEVQTARPAGIFAKVTLPWATDVRTSGAYHPVFWRDGRFVVFSTGAQLVYGPSDGSWAPKPLLTGAQEPESVCDITPTAAPDGTLAFERLDGASCARSQGIWTYDVYADTLKRLVPEGSQPVFSHDGAKLAFRKKVGEWWQLFTANADGSGITQVTKDEADHGYPSWDPAGGRIVHESSTSPYSDGVTTVKILNLADGSSATLTDKGYRPAWQPLRKNYLDRVYGTGDVAIDSAASRWSFDTLGGTHVPGLRSAKSAVLTNKGNATYAVPGIALAAQKQGPLLYTSAGSLDAAATKELKRTLPKGSTVYLNGGTNLLSSKIVSQVRALGYNPLRLEGADLPALSARVGRQISSAPSWVFVADGNDYHDSTAAAAAAGALGYRGTGIVLLTRGRTMPSSVRNTINALDLNRTRLVTVGYNANQALQNASFDEGFDYWYMGGRTHEDVAVNLAEFWWSSPVSATVQDTWTWQNGAVAAASNATYGPFLWSSRDRVTPAVENYLGTRAASLWNVQAYGPNDSYPAAWRTGVASAIAANSKWTRTRWIAAGVTPDDLFPATTAKQPFGAGPASADAPMTSEGTAPGTPEADGPRMTLGSTPNADLPEYNARTTG